MSWLDINAQIQIGSCDSYGNPAQVRGVPFENWNENAVNTYEYFPDQEIFTSLFTFELEWRQQKALHRILKKKKSLRSSKSVLIRRVCRKDLCHVWQHHKKGANIFCSEQVSGAALHFGDFFFWWEEGTIWNHVLPHFPNFSKWRIAATTTLPVDWTYDFPKHVDLLGSIVVHDNVRNNLHKIVRDDCKDKKLMLFSSPQCGCLLVYNVLLHWLLKRKFCVLNKEHTGLSFNHHLLIPYEWWCSYPTSKSFSSNFVP